MGTKGDSQAAVSRRRLLKGTAALAVGASATAAALEALAIGSPPQPDSGYGPLRPVPDATSGLPLLQLPEGFTYRTLGITGEIMSDGTATPPRHDGMAVIAERGDSLILVRNHEIGIGTPFGTTATPVYDPEVGGGTTTLVFNGARGELIDSWASLTGTAVNCAGGPNPLRGSWLTCEETDDFGVQGTRRTAVDHGFIFEVPVENRATGAPLTAMGRFQHEAVAVDPTTGIAYQTEDDGLSGFYRFVPNDPTEFAAGGLLHMARVVGSTNAASAVNLNGQRDPASKRNRHAAVLGLPIGFEIAIGQSFQIDWVPITDPAPSGNIDSFDATSNFDNRVVAQGLAQGACLFTRGEGCWHHNGSVYFTATDGGAARRGQVWEYRIASSTLTLLFVSKDAGQLSNPDNITVAPSGALLICEDGRGARHGGGEPPAADRLIGLTAAGELFPFAANSLILDNAAALRLGVPAGDYRKTEWAGASFSKTGKWLFANIQVPGITVAITGPWHRGPFKSAPV